MSSTESNNMVDTLGAFRNDIRGDPLKAHVIELSALVQVLKMELARRITGSGTRRKVS